ncbi:hypothetical protein FB45DRAFT_871425 [Roridomyces roridus]|uniref:Uncharacterized protein n=1 Tax=Roridomyces roridus TaxID=1738132 RepID=A0AAD7BH13_9AGAR|nr:hypothetical protein FB45DRAFT_871425 [Roridomyces roridus]
MVTRVLSTTPGWSTFGVQHFLRFQLGSNNSPDFNLQDSGKHPSYQLPKWLGIRRETEKMRPPKMGSKDSGRRGCHRTGPGDIPEERVADVLDDGGGARQEAEQDGGGVDHGRSECAYFVYSNEIETYLQFGVKRERNRAESEANRKLGDPDDRNEKEVLREWGRLPSVEGGSSHQTQRKTLLHPYPSPKIAGCRCQGRNGGRPKQRSIMDVPPEDTGARQTALAAHGDSWREPDSGNDVKRSSVQTKNLKKPSVGDSQVWSLVKSWWEARWI